MDKFSYFVATEKDISFISEIYNENIQSLHGNYRSYENWKELLSDEKSIYYIVQTKMDVAWFRIDLLPDELCLGMLQVKPIYQRKGIGKYILSVVENIAQERYLNKVCIHTIEDNVAARRLYLSAGYTVTEIGPCITADGKERIGYTFKKAI